MAKPDFPNEPWRWNRWFASTYDSEAANIADDFYIADKACDYALLSAHWMVKNANGKKLDPVFAVAEILSASKKEGWTPDPVARVIDSQWRSYVRWKLEEPPVIITPPAPEPLKPVPVPEEPKKLPEVPTPKPPVAAKPPWKLIATILAAVAFFLKFTPIPATIVLAIDWIVRILNALPQ